MSLSLEDLREAEAFQTHFVSPLVDAVRAEVQPIAATLKLHEERLAVIEKDTKKVVTVYKAGAAVFSSVGGLVLAITKIFAGRKTGK